MSSEEDLSPKTLWILACESDSSRWLEITYFYAGSEEEAREKAQRWIEETGRPLREFHLQNVPYGFRMGFRELQGMIPKKVVEQG